MTLTHARSTVAYFSMEICLEQAIPTYSGGLGVLAGDTLRSRFLVVECPEGPTCGASAFRFLGGAFIIRRPPAPRRESPRRR